MPRILNLFLILGLVTCLLAGDYIFTECNVNPGTDRVEISWITASESRVSEFIILRGRDTDNLSEIARLQTKGPGSHYIYIDKDIMFKSAHVTYYKIRAVDSNGNIIEESQDDLSVIPNVSGVHRTWGAIKALFR